MGICGRLIIQNSESLGFLPTYPFEKTMVYIVSLTIKKVGI